MLGACTFPGNPYDGHILSTVLEQATNLTQDLSVTIKQVVADLGFRGKEVDADNPGVQIIHRGGYKSLSLLVIKQPWPGMIRTIWGDDARYRSSYFPPELRGYYLAGDGALRDPETTYFTITGRVDDVLNVSGHRMGTMEIESALVSCTEWVAEAAVVGRPDDATGEAVCAFVVLKGERPAGDKAREVATLLRNWVAREIGPIAKPKDIRFADNLPKTRSGKIMRRLLRSIARGEAITQDTSTLENPQILAQLAERV